MNELLFLVREGWLFRLIRGTRKGKGMGDKYKCLQGLNSNKAIFEKKEEKLILMICDKLRDANNVLRTS